MGSVPESPLPAGAVPAESAPPAESARLAGGVLADGVPTGGAVPAEAAEAPAGQFRRRLAALGADPALAGRGFCEAYTQLADDLMAHLWQRAGGHEPAGAGLALVAVGGYGRAELCPGSDLDLVLLHQGRGDQGAADALAERLWYPLWDAGMKLGHAIRTVKEALGLAASHLETATSLLDVRALAGNTALADDLAERAAAQWRDGANRELDLLRASVLERHARYDEVAFLLEPDIKEGRGGLRDVHALRWAEAASPILRDDDRQDLADAYRILLDVRVELHRRTGKASNQLVLQEQDAVAQALGDTDADALMARVAAAGRSVAWVGDEAWARVDTKRERGRNRPSSQERRLGRGLVERGGVVELAADADVAGDPTLALRAAAVAAEEGARLGPDCLMRLATEAPELGDPWPEEARRSLIRLLDTGRPALVVLEALDQKGILVRLLPEWAPVRSRPQRNAYHRFTVDRHLFETAIEAAERVVRVRRPDLLLVGALLHDIGKGYVPELADDHTAAGITVVERLAPRLGFAPEDVAVLVAMVRHHLLLPDVATRRDLADPATIEAVAEAVGDAGVLELLHVLTESDSIATGPAAWSPWKAGLVDELVARVAAVLAGEPREEPTGSFPTAEHLGLVAATAPGGVTIRASGSSLVVVAADRPGLFCRVTGVLALHSLEVLSARAWSSNDGVAVDDFVVEPMFGGEPRWPRIEADLHKAVSGRLSIESRMNERARQYGARRPPTAASPARTAVDVDNQASALATVVEVRTPDSVGVLYRITRALAGLDLDIRSAKVATLGHEVVDAFYVVDGAGAKIDDPDYAAEIRSAVLAELSRV